MDGVDVAAVRADTPGCTAQMAHFNNAGAALPPKVVTDAQVQHLLLESTTGGYEAAASNRSRCEAVYISVAALLNCKPSEVALVESATVGWEHAFYSIPFEAGDRLLTCQMEYGANFVAYLQVCKRTGATVEVIPQDPATGHLCTASLERMLASGGRVRLVSISHMPTNGGVLNPAAEVGRIAREHGVLYLLDACQTVGQMPIDVAAIGCDMLTATGRKYLRGPRGTGFLFVSESVMASGRLSEPATLDHHGASWVAPDRYQVAPDARRYEKWEHNVAARLGLGCAADYCLHVGPEHIWARVQRLASVLRTALAALTVPAVPAADAGADASAGGVVSTVCVHEFGYDDEAAARNLGGIVTFSVQSVTAVEVKARLLTGDYDTTAGQGGVANGVINTSVTMPSATLLDARARSLPPMCRASVHYYNTEEEVETLVRAVQAIALAAQGQGQTTPV
jgi:cysteine desulfurase/selenocysteine lyase